MEDRAKITINDRVSKVIVHNVRYLMKKKKVSIKTLKQKVLDNCSYFEAIKFLCGYYIILHYSYIEKLSVLFEVAPEEIFEYKLWLEEDENAK